jgi:hypothetical protein
MPVGKRIAVKLDAVDIHNYQTFLALRLLQLIVVALWGIACGVDTMALRNIVEPVH